MLRLLTYFSLFLAVIPYKKNVDTVNRYQIIGIAQGTTYQITYYAKDSIISSYSIDSILHCIDTSMSLYNPQSLIRQFNASSYGIAMDKHMAQVISKSIQTYIHTKGYFDITVAPLVNAWGFGAGRPEFLPTKSSIKKLKKCIGSSGLIIRDDSLLKTTPCIQIDLNGIAQGYTVDVIAEYLTSFQITDFIVEIGGEIRTKGRKQPGNVKMKIGIEAPGQEVSDHSVFQRIILLENGAITTSGNYRRYFESDGRKFSHLINPFTGYPVENELISVTVYASDAITADAYDNALMVMGLKKALAFIERNKNIAAYFIYRKTNGQISECFSSRFRQLISQN